MAVGGWVMRNDAKAKITELLKELGLKEYEAQVFVALTRISHGSAREISELSDVPRPRVYDAGEQLAERGLVEVRQSKPQIYRAIPVADAVEVLRKQYDERFETLANSLSEWESDSGPDETLTGVWSLTGSETIARRATEIVDAANDEVVVLFGAAISDEIGISSLDTDPLVERLRTATDRGVAVYLGSLVPDEEVRESVRTAVPDARSSEGLEECLGVSVPPDDDIGYLVVADRNELLLSSVVERNGERVETAIRSTEFGNGLLALIRRLLEASLP